MIHSSRIWVAIQLKARVQAYVRYDQAARELTEKSMLLEDQVIMDSMTGLCSRRYLNQRGGQDLAFSIRRGNDLSLIRVDIDHVKKLYKTHGDDLSEDLLTWFAKLLVGCARTEDTVARIGGAQFAVLASATSIANATALCQRLQEMSRGFDRRVADVRRDASAALAALGPRPQLRVLLTGASGFLGKEVLVQSVEDPHVAEVICLLRPQRTRDPLTGRVVEVVHAPERGARLLRRLGIRGAAARRIRFVEGDVERPGLGLGAAETSRLSRTLHFHPFGASPIPCWQQGLHH